MSFTVKQIRSALSRLPDDAVVKVHAEDGALLRDIEMVKEETYMHDDAMDYDAAKRRAVLLLERQ